MTKLARTQPAVAISNTFVPPSQFENALGDIEHPALAFAEHVSVRAAGGEDVQSLLIPQSGRGAPRTDGSVVSVLYRDVANNRTYMRTGIDPIAYVAV